MQDYVQYINMLDFLEGTGPRFPLLHLHLFTSFICHTKELENDMRKRVEGVLRGEQLHCQIFQPKEEQHASPSGHLFSQVCSPNVIKIGAAYPLSNAVLIH